MNFKPYFKDKKITVMGAGLLGGLGDIRFLAEQGADLILTDLKSEKELEPSLKALREFKNIQYTLGRHDVSDFKDRGLIIKAPATPLDSPYIAEARKKDTPITMWAALFSRFAREAGATVVGVTGTRGKTTTTVMIAEILKSAGKKVIEGGNVQGTAMLPHLPELSKDAIAVLELDSWKIQGFREEKISPNIAVFTTFFPDHLNYYGGDMDLYLVDKAEIFLHQNEEDTLILGEQCADLIEKKYGSRIKSKIVLARAADFPNNLALCVPGEHNRLNAQCALLAARALGISDERSKEALERFRGVSGRLEFVREVNGVKFYNDTTATSPDATIAALEALDTGQKNIILIMGGADKGLDMKKLLKAIPQHSKKVVLLAGTGTERIEGDLPDAQVHQGLRDALGAAFSDAESGDSILLSPAFASFGMFKNEYDRGEQFVRAVQELS